MQLVPLARLRDSSPYSRAVLLLIQTNASTNTLAGRTNVYFHVSSKHSNFTPSLFFTVSNNLHPSSAHHITAFKTLSSTQKEPLIKLIQLLFQGKCVLIWSSEQSHRQNRFFLHLRLLFLLRSHPNFNLSWNTVYNLDFYAFSNKDPQMRSPI